MLTSFALRVYGRVLNDLRPYANLMYCNSYCLNVLYLDDIELFEKHGFYFIAAQRRSLKRLWEYLKDKDYSKGDLEEELLQVSARGAAHEATHPPFVFDRSRRAVGIVFRDNWISP
jgi:hypothetical protein